MEIEAKFGIEDEPTSEAIGGLDSIGDFEFSAPRTVKTHDVYLDSRERILLAGGYALRRRESESGCLLSLKSIAASEEPVQRREEIEEELGAQPSAGVLGSGPLREKIMDIAGEAPLVPLLELKQDRRVREICRSGRSIAELSLDQVEFQCGGCPIAWKELEIELGPQGTEEELGELVELFRERWELRAQTRSKFSRALDLLDRHDAVAVDNTMSEAAIKTLGRHFRRLLSREEAVRVRDDAEDVHDMRVASRRLLAALRVFAAALDPRAAKPARKELRRLLEILGAVRDLDVLEARILEYRDARPARPRPGLESLLGALNLERNLRRTRMLKYLASARYSRFKKDFPGLLDRREDGQDQGTVGRELPSILFDAYAKVRAFEARQDGEDPPLARYHRLRIAFKRLRYSLEFFEPALGPGVAPLIEAARKVQDHLGLLQDGVIACGLVSRFLGRGRIGKGRKSDPGKSMVLAPAAAIYLAARQADIKRLHRSFPALWRRVAGQGFAKRLGKIVSSL